MPINPDKHYGDFQKRIVRAPSFTLLAALEWIRENLEPHDVFPHLKNQNQDDDIAEEL